MAQYTIGIDLGGTNIKGVVIDERGEVILHHAIPTNDNEEFSWKKNTLDMVIFLKDKLQKPINGIGIAAPGLPNESNSCITFLPNRLKGLEDFIWTDYLNEKTFVLNDAHAALMAEVNFGIANGKKNLILLTLGTGVGGGILINGQLYQGLSQMAGHFGHTIVDSGNDTQSIVGMVGSLEYAVGNYSVKSRTHGRFSTTLELVEAFRKGDYLATYCWLTSVRKLALAISSLINILSPEMVVLAGGITYANEALFEPLNTFMDLYEWQPAGKKTPIVQAHFGDLAGAIGAASSPLPPMGELKNINN